MIIYQHKIFFNVEFSFPNLFFCGSIRIKLKFLSHFFNAILFLIMFVIDEKMYSLIYKFIRVISNASIDKPVFSSLKPFKCFFPYLFFSVNKTVFNSVMIEENFSVLIIFLYQFFPVVLLFWRFIMFNSYKLIWESSS
jgi:hypothetical protein